MEWRTPRPRRGLDPRLTDAVGGRRALRRAGPLVRRHPGAAQRPADVWAWVLALLLTAPYAVHRRYPWGALAVVLAALLAFSLLHYAAFPGVSVFVLCSGSPCTAVAGLAASRSGRRWQPSSWPSQRSRPAWSRPATRVDAARHSVAWLAGDNLRQRRLRWTAMEERTRLLEREREERARAAVAAERLRIARELHDIVAHSMSVVAVQAGVGRHVIDTDVAAAGQALAVIETTSRDALVDLRRMLGVLRRGDEVAATRPMPGLTDIPASSRRRGRPGWG